MLQRMGYSKVNNIGGIAAYSGKAVSYTHLDVYKRQVCKLDVAGVAIGTIVSQFVSCVLVLYCLSKADTSYKPVSYTHLDVYKRQHSGDFSVMQNSDVTVPT